MVALERAGIKADKYDAFEIDDDAILVSKTNYPQIIQHGSVVDADFSQFIGYDLLIGGSPCQDLCKGGTRQGLKGERSGLFYEYVRALREIKPKWFLLENNASMTKKDQAIITEIMGVEPVLIDSADFSAQMRKRLYWTNIPVFPYEKSQLKIADIYEYDVDHVSCSDKVEKYLFSGEYSGRKIERTIKAAVRTLDQKSRTVCTRSWDIGSNAGIYYKLGKTNFVLPTRVEYERMQTLPDGYTAVLPLEAAVKTIGNGWTVDVISHIFKGILKKEKI